MSLWDRVRGARVETSAPEDHSASPNPSASRDHSAGPNPSAASSTAGANAGAAVGSGAAALSAALELAEFTPRQDGEYACAERGLILRFTHTTVVETDAAEAEPAVGDFMGGARFSVQRRFGRPIVFTVLEPGHDGALVLRRTDTATRQAERLAYTFAPDGG